MACMADLPAELLASIFLLAVFACDGVPALRNAPWNVCQTCRLWRSITLNDGRLWAHLQLYKVDGLCYGDEDGQQILIGPDGGLRLLRIWLNRSHYTRQHQLKGLGTYRQSLSSWTRLLEALAEGFF
ncbi:hypothetical protein DFJ43DRAFT_1141860 [Lentinula guzmanii]|uniref:F-box domain-containing protein n=1 Tax=Lentinula guzmanii TaxID=2804957 RepID=A0AA38J3B3_9AGAR|nr:hypothetical protein DFJ43DRAFT_1141860 [Lentinula guzmanii]